MEDKTMRVFFERNIMDTCLCGHNKSFHLAGGCGGVDLCSAQRPDSSRLDYFHLKCCCVAYRSRLEAAFEKCAEAVARHEGVRCVCGHGLFEHEKEPKNWVPREGVFTSAVFTLSGRCVTCPCHQFRRAEVGWDFAAPGTDYTVVMHSPISQSHQLGAPCFMCDAMSTAAHNEAQKGEWKDTAKKFHRALRDIEALLGWSVIDAKDGNDRLQRIRAIIRAATLF